MIEPTDLDLTLLDHIPMGFFVLDGDMRVHFWNKLLEGWTNIKQIQIVGKKITEFYPHFDLPKYSKRIQSVLRGGSPTVFSSQLHQFIIPIYQQNGEKRTQHTTVTSIQHEYLGTLALFAIQDVTDLSCSMKKYRRMRDQALNEIEERKKIELTLIKEKDKVEVFAAKLKLLSTIDSLTEILNRRGFDEYLTKEYRRAIREKKPISLIMIDIDFFKKFNDTFGHQAGDDCLRIVAQKLQSITRSSGDMLARYGGEEFAIILPDTTLHSAITIANRNRISIEKLAVKIPFVDKIQTITISSGVSSIVPDGSSNEETLIKTADLALYQAKLDGRNLVVSKTVLRNESSILQ